MTGGGATSTKTAALTVGGAAGCTTTSWVVTNPGFEYDFSGVTGANPAITVCKGKTFISGGTNNCITRNQVLTWAVPANLAAGARYICDIHFFGDSFTIQ